MEIPVYSPERKQEGRVQLPPQFDEPVSRELISRAVITIQLNRRQPYGTKPGAGTRVSAQVSRRRRKYRGSYGKGISRVPRKIMSHRGSQFNWRGALMPGTVKGRRAHPPKSYDDRSRKINKKENRKAIRSALSATLVAELVSKRGSIAPEGYPFAVSDSISSIGKTKAIKQALEKLGLQQELSRTSKKTLRAGRGKARGRKYDTKTGPLIVVAEKCPMQKAAANIPGVDVVTVKNLNAELLAPGAVPGRLTIFTPSALGKMKSDKLFT